MRILLNATTLRKGGPLQRAVTFLLEVQKDSLGHTWHVALSDTVDANLQRLGADRFDHKQVFTDSPARSLKARRRLRRLEDSVSPDCVFTFTGPAYVRFGAPHLLGCTSLWLTHWPWNAFRVTGSPPQWIRRVVERAYKGRWLRQADGWVVQTATAQRGLQQRLGVPPERIAVVSNTCGSLYLGQPARSETRPRGPWRILCFAAPYPHKRLELIPDVAAELIRVEPTLPFEFVLTLPHTCDILRRVERRARSIGVQERINNIGPIPVAEGPGLYKTCDVSFLPTVLETFSATYPEAMAMRLPIVTTDLAFARDVCGDAALYFEPNNAKSAAKQLLSVIGDPKVRQRLIESGTNVLATFPLPAQQYRRYCELLAELHAGHRQTLESGRSSRG